MYDVPSTPAANPNPPLAPASPGFTPADTPPVPPQTPAKRPRGKVLRLILAVLPLLVIGGLVYLAFNFPALKNQAQYALNKPGNSKQLPATIRTGTAPGGPAASGGGTAPGAAAIPVGGAACGRPVPYDRNGNPTAICDNYVYIPKIGVAAPMVWPSSTSEGVINENLLKGIVHYPGTAEPGQKGNVFLTGHSSYYWWVPSDYRTVFTLVPKLVPGDEIIVYHKGVRYSYRVTDYQDVKPTNTDSLKPTTDPVVTLSTCVPIGTSYERRIVRAKQVSPDPATARNASSNNSSTPGRLPGVR